MSFDKMNIRNEYRNQHVDVVNSFYLPLFKEAKLYCRAVGFFSSTIFSKLAVGLESLADNGGKIEIITSPSLSEEDLEAIKLGYELREEVIKKAIIREMYEPKNLFEKQSLNLLANYIADGTLDLKIALVGKYDNSLGIYHEKLGLLYDYYDNIVAFSGSQNESISALEYNYEIIDVFCSWKENDKQRVEEKERAFSLIWNGFDDKVKVVDFPEVKAEIIKRYKYTNKLKDNIFELSAQITKKEEENHNLSQKPLIGIPADINLFDYQIEAINNWRANNYIGIFDMATGTGKTYTGISGLCKLFEDKKRLFSIIVCPFQHLVEQWVDDLKKFGINPIIGYSAPEYKNYRKKLRNAIFDYNIEVLKFVCFICTKDTFADEDVQNQIRKIKYDCLLMVDEAHNMGARTYAKLLDMDIYKYRLGLSATLDRFNDKVGTNMLYNFFGEKCIEYNIERAINEEKLTKYYYYPIVIELTEEELDKYRHISKEIIKHIIIDEKGRIQLDDLGKLLTITRAREIAGARNKIPKLIDIMKQYKNDNHILVYCGATTSIKEDDEFIRQIDLISDELWNKLHIKTAQFTAREDAQTRKKLIEEFSDGSLLQALIAIKCLDEGVNIPAIDKAFILASTTNPKEFIQRRGRVLRKYKGKEFSKIYDFITLPRKLEDVIYLSEEDRKLESSLIKNEVARIEEFARIAENSVDSVNLIMKLKDAYKLYDEEVDNYEI